MTLKAPARRPRLPLSTARLTLREFVAADQADYRALMLDARVAQHLPHAPADAAEADRSFARLFTKQQRLRRDSWELAVTLAPGGAFIGVGDLTVTEPGMMNLGYALARRYWGKGYALELAQALATVAFRDLHTPQLYATISVDNTRSMAIAEKLGLRWEATLRGSVRSRGRLWDMHLYTIDREQWFARQT